MPEFEPATYIAPAAMGLGDLVMTLPVVQSLIAQGEAVHLVLRLLEHLPLVSRIPGLADAVLEWQVDSRLRQGDRFYNLRDHYLQRRFWWGSRDFVQAYPGCTINDVLQLICLDFGIEARLCRLDKLLHEPNPAVSDTVLFVPGSAVSAKSWSSDAWLLLAERLSQQRLPVGIVGQPHRSSTAAALVDAGLTHYETPTIADALDLISSCRAVVSVDTGLMHLAVHQGVPTVGIFRPHPVYIRQFPHFRAVVAGNRCADQCYQLENRCAHHHRDHAGPEFQPQDWTCQAVSGHRCLDSVLVADVLQALQELIPAQNSTSCRDRLFPTGIVY